MSSKPALLAAAAAIAAGGLLLVPRTAAPSPAADAGAAKQAAAGGGGDRTAAVSFVADVMPLLSRLGCNSGQCHGSSQARGGLRLSMFGAYPQDDYAAIAKAAAGRRIDTVEPAGSLLILKCTEGIPHQGGKAVQPGSAEYNLLASWVAQGAAYDDATAPRLVSIQVAPDSWTLQKGQAGRLTVTALYSDGSRKDVTRDVRCQSSAVNVADVSADGQVAARDFGQAAIVVSYLRHFAVGRAVVPQPLPFAFPPVPANNRIDEPVAAKLKELGVPPSPLCSDSEFLRRVYLDVIGVLPTPDEARAFLADRDPQKRAKLIDRLLERGEFADFWALKWGDLLRLKSEYPINLWPNAVQAYYHWIRDAIAKNKPYDQFVTEMLTATGSNFRSPPANYFRAMPKRDPQSVAEATALVFMGARLGCARCHAHPSADWTRDDSLGMAAFFAKVQFKPTQEWKEEIVFVNPEQVLRHPTTGRPVTPRFLEGPAPQIAKDDDPRAKFAEWLTAPGNPWFARNIVNRVWSWLLGRGIIDEPDDLRSTNPPSNPELLAYLETELVAHKYDLRHIYRLILNSRTYQLSSKADPWNAGDASHFSHYPLKRLGAEQLLDAIGQVTETSERFESRVPEPFTVLPPGSRAEEVCDGSIGAPFLELFGRPPRDTPYESDRSLNVSMRQMLHLINSAHVEGRIARSPRLARLLKAGKTDAEIVEEIYLAALSRFPSDPEKTAAVQYVAKDAKARPQAVRDLVWAVLNTKEFLFNH